MADKDFSQRLRTAREKAGLSITEAARRLGYPSYQTLSKIEEGERIVKAAELTKFAQVYYSSVTQLLGIKEPGPPATFLWRSAAKNDKRLEAESHISKHCGYYSMLEKALDVSRPDGLPLFVKSRERLRTNNDVDNIAFEACNYLNLGKRPACSLVKVLEQEYGVKLLYIPLSDSGSAASLVHPEWGVVIAINSDDAPWRRVYDVGHELFHLLTWDVVMPEEQSNHELHQDLEKKADRFSSTLLLPEGEVKKEIRRLLSKPQPPSLSDVVDLAREFGVSTKALLYRLANLRLMEWEKADELAKNEDLSNIDRQQRRSDWGKPPRSERFDFLAIQCLRKGLVSRGKFAEMLEIDRSDIDCFIDGYGLMETEGGQVEIMAP